jgi:prolipoprotein diacylglyceryl transferase
MEQIFSAIYWDPAREMLPFNLPFLGRPILWYGFFFALGFLGAYRLLVYLLKGFLDNSSRNIKEDAAWIAEKTTLYVMVGTLVGARLGDVLFYQSWADYSRDLWSIVKIWEGGLASHGGVAGIIISLMLLARRLKSKFNNLSWKALIDLLVVPSAFAAGCIRIGNFFNQEILGYPAHVPWAVTFGHPADGGPVVPRHPVQLYESIFYFILCAAMLRIYRLPAAKQRPGWIGGWYLLSIFSFRFFIEFFKEEQSIFMDSGALFHMGQYLSLPLIGIGILLLVKARDALPAKGCIERN